MPINSGLFEAKASLSIRPAIFAGFENSPVGVAVLSAFPAFLDPSA
jgi:hypothetical protein